MNDQPYRLPEGGRILRDRPLAFIFNGRTYRGYAGDTLASALLANGVRLVARSFKYHRPRGIVGAGVEEPNALVQLEYNARAEPNRRATEIALYDGLNARSQNCWPSPRFDLGGISQAVSRLLPAGFYYKTFMAPARAWPWYERWIRSAAGQGRAPAYPDPDHYEHRHWHTDVAVVGAGPAGIAAALAASQTGCRVLLVHSSSCLGAAARISADHRCRQWLNDRLDDIKRRPNVRLLPNSTVVGYYDGNFLTAVETLFDGASQDLYAMPRQRFWKIRADQVVLATGAIERPLIFANNDRPGVMLTSAARRYATEYAVGVGHRLVIATNNDSAYEAALDLQSAGVQVSAIVDSRDRAETAIQQRVHETGIECLNGQVPLCALGRRTVKGLAVGDARSSRTRTPTRRLSCDAICTSGGWNPTVHLFSQSLGRLRFDEDLATFIPDRTEQPTHCAGALNGHFTFHVAVQEGWQSGMEAARAVGFTTAAGMELPADAFLFERTPAPTQGSQPISSTGRGGKCFVDLQNDVTADDIALAVREGYRSVEHLKRYTTLGMGTDQGRTSNVNGLALLAKHLDKPIPTVGFTTFRPPYTAITLSALAGHRRGPRFKPLRRTPLDDSHQRLHATFVNVGLWRRPRSYPRGNETLSQSVQREVAAVRRTAGIVDISTLGRIEVQGKDAVTLLERVYATRVGDLPVGRCRYGLMLREDGFVFDDGTVTRLGESHFHLTTTTAHAEETLQRLEHYRQTEFRGLKIFCTPVTEQWAGIALAGPKARDILHRLRPTFDVSAESSPFLSAVETFLDGTLPVRLFRVSYSGELAFEITAPADRGPELWRQILDAGQDVGVTPYGTDAMDVLRIEKGHCAVGGEIDGRTTAQDLGLGKLVSKDADFVGRRGLEREALRAPGRRQLVGLTAEGQDEPIPAGTQLVEDTAQGPKAQLSALGDVTATCYSPSCRHHIALALLSDGRHRLGQSLRAMAPLQGWTGRVRVCKPIFFDPAGKRLRV